ncbi:hybrid sensor histidine kinase/response regulator [Pseudodesulfovibrio piezophilus]|uniref:hybrid sensor histidine kinase/response regulator n=1 Tax=Pseudodesulfovibrio piezophilus TaxID=879567 RepID=UPI002ADE5D79|nr:response regulator [Pseudodesulfovibrio piezophilus]
MKSEECVLSLEIPAGHPSAARPGPSQALCDLPFSPGIQYVWATNWATNRNSAHQEEHPLAEETRRFRVLAVDHDEEMLTRYRDVLCFEGEEPAELEALFNDDLQLPSQEEIRAEANNPIFEVIPCLSPEQALSTMANSLAKKNPFAIALVEVHLGGRPTMAGIDLAEKIRALDHHIEIVLLSSEASVPLKEINKRVCPPEKLLYVQKPFRSAELKQIAASLCSKRDLENRLYELNETLTSKVEARTAELNAVNRRLRLDIAKRASVLRELQASERRYRMLFEKDITGNFAADGDGLILDCNGAFTTLFNFDSPQDAHGQDIFTLWDIMGASEPLHEIIAGHHRVTNHEIVLRRGGINQHLLANFDTVFSEEGKLEELRGYIFDMSEPKRLEEQLRQSQKMEALGTLAGGIAHDFNNILGVILGYAEIIESSAEPESGLERRVREIARAGKRARDLVNQILNFSRQGPQERHPMTLTPLIKEALKLLRSSMPTNVEIISRMETDQDSVLADPTQMHQIMLNLCANASYAMKARGGTLTVTLTDASHGDEIFPSEGLGSPERFVRLSVSDTGNGIPTDVVERIFDPFFTTKKQGEGTGMGLAMVHGIVKRHDGYLELENHLGQGATFHVFLPKTAMDERPVAEATSELVFREGRILFVDDEKPLTDIGREMLVACGFEVVTRTSSIEALEAFRHRAGEYDLVITDQTMPNMNGMELAREILKIRPDMPIILCTGFSDAVSYDRLRDIGIGDFIMKPILKHDLIASISRQLIGH